MAREVTEFEVRELLAQIDAGRLPERRDVCGVVAAFSDVLSKPGIWATEAGQMKGMQRLAVLEIGTLGTIKEAQFAERMLRRALFNALPAAIAEVASVEPDERIKRGLRERADWLLYDAPVPRVGAVGSPAIGALHEIASLCQESRAQDLERGRVGSDTQAIRDLTEQAAREAKKSVAAFAEGQLVPMTRAAAWADIAAGMAIAIAETKDRPLIERERRRDHQAACVAETAAQALIELSAPAQSYLRLLEPGRDHGHEEGPWAVQPHQASHGCQLAVVRAEDGLILALTPERDAYGVHEQLADKANAELMALGPVMHKGIWSVENELQEIEAFDERLTKQERVPTGDDYNVIYSIAHAALEKLTPVIAEMRRSAESVVQFQRLVDAPRVNEGRDGDEDEEEQQAGKSR